MVKALFLDIDGTLVSFQTHAIPTSTVQALEEAKAQGVKIFISTGRPVAIIDNLGAIEHLIDGYVTANGAFCFVGDEVVSCNAIPQEDVDTVVRFSDEENFACLLVGERHIAVHRPNELLDRIFRMYLNVSCLSTVVPLSDLHERIIQITPIIPLEREQSLMPLLHGCISGRWHPDFTDITAIEADKGEGIARMACYFDIPIAETMAIGDGGNDVAMLRRAGISVAMGNAVDAVKAAATYVTTTVDDDGIRNALLHWHVIGNNT